MQGNSRRCTCLLRFKCTKNEEIAIFYILFNLFSSCSSLMRNTSSMIQICISRARCLKKIVPVVLSQARAKTSAFLAYFTPNLRDTVSSSCRALPPAFPLLQDIKIGHTCFIKITSISFIVSYPGFTVSCTSPSQSICAPRINILLVLPPHTHAALTYFPLWQ